MPHALKTLLILIPLLGFSTTCARTVEVPVVEPSITCPLPEWPQVPELGARACSDHDVCIPWEAARELRLYMGRILRWHEVAQACIDAQHFQPPTPLPFEATKATDYEALKRQSMAAELILSMTLEGMHVTYNWAECGEVNAYYIPAIAHITLCQELLDQGLGLTRFVVAHEMGHAIINQLDIPYTGLEEMAADEIGAVVLHLIDHQEDVVEAARYFKQKGRPEYADDPHPSDARRFVTLSLLAADTPYFQRALRSWAVLLAGHRG